MFKILNIKGYILLTLNEGGKVNITSELSFCKLKDKFYYVCDYIQANKKIFIFPFLLIILIMACYTKDDNDMYFLYENGKEILTNGIPYYDWMSMHEGLQITLQQWIVCVIDFLVWDNFGVLGIQFYITCVLFLLGCSMYYLSYLKTNNLFLSMMFLIIPIVMVTLYTGNARPQIWSLMIVVWALIAIEKYSQTHNIKFMCLLPLLSLMLANFHATFWTALIAMQFCYSVYFIIRDKKDRKELVLILTLLFVLSIGVGFLNPYGYMALISPYLTIGHKGYDKITELMAPDTETFIWGYMSMFLVFIVSLFIRNKNKKNFLLPVDVFIMAIILIYSTNVFRTFIFYLLFIMVCVSDVWVINKDNVNSLKAVNIKEKSIKFKLEYALFCLILIICVGVQYMNSTNEFFERRTLLEPMQEVIDYLEDTDEDIEGKTVFSTEMGFGNLAYGQLGTRSYTDGRFENYIIQFNKKFDYIDEIIDLTDSPSKKQISKNLDNFVDKYKFDYLVLGDKTTINLMFENDNYELVYQQDSRKPYENFYVYKRKD